MKSAAPIPALVLALAVVALAATFAPPLLAGPPAAEDLVGSTWQLVARKYGDAKEWENVPSTERKIKVITDTHFVWVAYDPDTGKIESSGGGTYALAGAAYTETIEFGDGEMSGLRGKKQVFTFDLKGDRLEQTGQLSTGLKIAEVWQRVR
jgi:hypothetical protein